ncbi:MAG: PadR family transcriptional regulator [Spirochaetales bacterium]|nr:PadR family transcriptional regulator [Spirochaetales bacterium]
MSSRTRHAILGGLAHEAASGYEIRKFLSETTSHFWKEGYGQIYPTLERLVEEKLIEVASREAGGRERVRYRILPAGSVELRTWIRSPRFQLKSGRNELLLKLFFARRDDAAALLPQIQEYRVSMQKTAGIYSAFDLDADEIPDDSRSLIATTIDYSKAAARMQIEWCERTLDLLASLAKAD